jgi:hypothetical protein
VTIPMENKDLMLSETKFLGRTESESYSNLTPNLNST